MQFVTFRDAICHISGKQFVTLRKAPKSCIHIRKFIFLSAVAALAVSLSRSQNGKSCDGSEERARSWRKNGEDMPPQRRDVRVENDEYEREQQRLAKQIKRVVVLIRTISSRSVGFKKAFAFSNSFKVMRSLCLPPSSSHNFHTSLHMHVRPTSPKVRATPTN